MYKMQKRTTFGFSAENPTGTRNGGTRGKDCEKLCPRITIPAGETATLCDIDGEGMITHMWFYYLTEPAALPFELPENSELVMK
jgi:hypothetical protein